MIGFSDDESIKDSLQRYFQHYGFNNGGYNDKRFTIQFWGPIKLTLPNTKGRIAAVKRHDLHHIITQYEANLRGEAEIGAWELASGCGSYMAAWVLNSGSVAYGIFLWPGRMYMAFIWGFQSRNLYDHSFYPVYDEKLLHKTVGQLRSELIFTKKSKFNLFKANLIYAFAVCLIYGLAALLVLMFFWFLYSLV